MITSTEFARMLNGRKYGHEITKDEEQLAKDNGLVVVFAYSDDNMEFRGAINGEIDCYDGGGTAYLDKDGLFANNCDDDDCPYAREMKGRCKTIQAEWDDRGNPTWTYNTDIPCEVFDILEDGELWCYGIVFEMAALSLP